VKNEEKVKYFKKFEKYFFGMVGGQEITDIDANLH